VALSRFDEKQLAHVMQRMTSYWIGTTPVTYQMQASTVASWGKRGGVQARPPSKIESEQAQVVAAVNLSRGQQWQYPLKTFPRPAGENTNVIYTMYDLPRVAAKPHDVVLAPDGAVYYDDFNDDFLGKLDPRTGKIVEWNTGEKFPQLAEEGGVKMTPGNRVLSSDGQGKLYMTPPAVRGGPGYAVVFDTKSQQFELFPGAGYFTAPNAVAADGYVWGYGAGGVNRLKFLANGKVNVETVPEKLDIYDVYTDSKNNALGGGRTSNQLWRVDANTLKVTYYPIPKEPRGETGFGPAGPRRGRVDRQNRLWFGSFDGEVVGMFDPSKPADQAVTLYTIPMRWFQPYMAQSDDAGYVWTGSMSGDYVARMNEKTGKWNLYLLPGEADIRGIWVQPGQNGALSSLWVGMNHEGRIVHIEPQGQ
jgi:streptogramin lyase